MSGDMAIQLGREALTMVMLVSAPMLGLGLIVGILVSIFQATTQIQEQRVCKLKTRFEKQFLTR